MQNDILNKQAELCSHPLYKSIKTIDDLKVFMSFHVYAVWDFMSLLKSLQKSITCVSVPWTRSKYSSNAVRLINEIVLGEESDEHPTKGYSDHFTLYLDAMKEVGANTTEILEFCESLNLKDLPGGVREFVSFNLDIALNHKPHVVAASFLYGRESLIPEMFTSILKEVEDMDCPCLKYYLERHIELDGDKHSHMAQDLLNELCSTQEEYDRAILMAEKSLLLREKLWTNALNSLNKSSFLGL